MQPENQTPPPVAPEPAAGSPARKRWPFPKRATLIGAVILVAILAAAGYMIFGSSSNSKNNQRANSNVYYYNRPGYDTKKLSSGTGDPEALKPVANATPVAYGGSPVVQACNVLSLDDLHKANLHLAATPLTEAMTRNFFDGKGRATLGVLQYSLPSGDTANECEYTLEDGLSLTLDVYQPSYVPASAVQNEIGTNGYQSRPAVNGSPVFFQQPEGDLQYYLVQTGNSYIKLSVASGQGAADKPDAVAGMLLHTITQNMNAQLAHPTGAAKMTYDSPVFVKSYANACELTDNTDFHTLYSLDSSPIVTEDLASGVGVINFSDTGAANVNYNYIDNDCERESVSGGASADASGNVSVNQVHLIVQTESFLSDQPATLSFASDQKSGQNITSVPYQIGDQAMFSSQAALNYALTFRQGRFIVNLSVVQPGSKPSFSTSAMIKSLTPLAQKIAAELKTQE